MTCSIEEGYSKQKLMKKSDEVIEKSADAYRK